MQKRKYVYEPTGAVIETTAEISGEGWKEIEPETILDKQPETEKQSKPASRAKRAKK